MQNVSSRAVHLGQTSGLDGTPTPRSISLSLSLSLSLTCGVVWVQGRSVIQNPESTVASGYFFAYDDGAAVIHSAGFDLDTGNKYYNVLAALLLMALISFWGIKQMPLLFKKEHIQSI
jgi:hypothetical protein